MRVNDSKCIAPCRRKRQSHERATSPPQSGKHSLRNDGESIAITNFVFQTASARRACPVRAKPSAIALFLCGAGYAVVFSEEPPRPE
jgi:hypothetical protein